MGSDWEKVTIESIQAKTKGAIAIGPFGSRLKSDNYVESGIPVIRGTNISASPTFEGEFVFITPEKADTLGSSNVYQNDLVFPHRGSIGEVGIVLGKKRYVLSSSLMKLTVDSEQINPMYLYYFFKSRIGRYELLKNASQVGTPGIGQPLSSLKSIEFLKPSLDEQNKIVEILKTLDNKITLNRQINQTLEKMAQTLFKSWFVDFDPVIDNALDAGNAIPDELQARAEQRQALRNAVTQQGDASATPAGSAKPLPDNIRQLFPNEFEESELGWVPKGWGSVNLTKLVDTISKTYPLKTVEEVIFLNTGDIENGRFLHSEFSKVVGLPGQAKKSIQRNDILFSEIRPKNKRFALVNFEPEHHVVSTKLMVLRAKKDVNPLFAYFLLTLGKTTNELQRIAELRSGTFPQITYNELGLISFALPENSKLIERFVESYLQPFYEKSFKAVSENETLTLLRDTLLPKLISGELRLDDVKSAIEETMTA